MYPKKKKKATFMTHYDQYEYSMMLFGVFMEYTNNIFHPYLARVAVVYMGDIFVCSESDEEHVKHLQIVLQTLKEIRWCAMMSKCEFRLREVSFLGHVISSNEIAVNPSKVDAVFAMGGFEDGCRKK
jgi:hypothetical protein